MGRKRYKAPPFVMVRQDLLKDKNWQGLSSSAKVLYIYLRSKFNQRTLSEVTLSYREMKGVMSTKTMSRSLKELAKEGFIEKIKQGGLFGGVSSYKFIGEYKDFCYKGFRV